MSALGMPLFNNELISCPCAFEMEGFTANTSRANAFKGGDPSQKSETLLVQRDRTYTLSPHASLLDGG